MNAALITSAVRTAAPHVGRAAATAGGAAVATLASLKAQSIAKKQFSKSLGHIEDAQVAYVLDREEDDVEDVTVTLRKEA